MICNGYVHSLDEITAFGIPNRHSIANTSCIRTITFHLSDHRGKWKFVPRYVKKQMLFMVNYIVND